MEIGFLASDKCNAFFNNYHKLWMEFENGYRVEVTGQAAIMVVKMSAYIGLHMPIASGLQVVCDQKIVFRPQQL